MGIKSTAYKLVDEDGIFIAEGSKAEMHRLREAYAEAGRNNYYVTLAPHKTVGDSFRDS
jgi:hypothetical protein